MDSKVKIWAGVVLAIVGGYALYEAKIENAPHSHDDPNDVHYHASFAVFVDGEKQDYSAYEFMKVSPCSVDSHTKPDLTDITERIHLHNGIGDVVHVHDYGVVWSDLFESLGKQELLQKTSALYRGKDMKPGSVLDAVLENDQVVITFGDAPTEDVLKDALVSKERIEEAEAQVEYCGT